MSHAVQSTAAQHGNHRGGLSDFDEDALPAPPVRHLNQVLSLALEQGVRSSPTTRTGDQDTASATLPVLQGPGQDGNAISRIVALPEPGPRLAPSATLHALQEWEGYVVEIGEDEFVARLVDLTAGRSFETEEATIPMEEISEDDAGKLREGDIFRWVIGYERSPSGTKRVSQIVFRDLPRMTAADFEEGRKWAERISRSLSP